MDCHRVHARFRLSRVFVLKCFELVLLAPPVPEFIHGAVTRDGVEPRQRHSAAGTEMLEGSDERVLQTVERRVTIAHEHEEKGVETSLMLMHHVVDLLLWTPATTWGAIPIVRPLAVLHACLTSPVFLTRCPYNANPGEMLQPYRVESSRL
jgi:hypothetical protein